MEEICFIQGLYKNIFVIIIFRVNVWLNIFWSKNRILKFFKTGKMQGGLQDTELPLIFHQFLLKLWPTRFSHFSAFIKTNLISGWTVPLKALLCFRNEVAGGIMFSGCPSVRLSVRPYVIRPSIRPVLVIALSEEPIDGFLPNFGHVCILQSQWTD